MTDQFACLPLIQQQYILNNILIMFKTSRLAARFCFFDRQISEKYGQKCCRYNQNGKPLPIERVNKIYSELGQFLKGWKIRQEGHKLVRHFYIEDYPLAIKYLEEVVKIDANEFKQCPTYKVQNGQLLTLELYSITLKGLSMVDFQFAIRIESIPYKKFSMFPIENEKDYRLEASMVRMERQAQQLQQQFEEDFKNREQKKD